ncbi:sulfite exporter TauE/SafE family protein, partial [Burkholderia multivorans]
MELWQIALIVAAGVGAGGINAVVGSGTLITFPVLVAFGVPPVVATMSNAVGLVPGNIASSFGYREELRGQWKRFAGFIPASLAGSLIGAYLLLHLPEDAFETIVP